MRRTRESLSILAVMLLGLVCAGLVLAQDVSLLPTTLTFSNQLSARPAQLK